MSPNEKPQIIIGLEGQAPVSLKFELDRGAKFVVYEYCISILITTLRRTSNIYFIKHRESRIGRGLIFTLVTLLFGWWAFPAGPFIAFGAIHTNLKGGRDVTADTLASLAAEQEMKALEDAYQKEKGWGW